MKKSLIAIAALAAVGAASAQSSVTLYGLADVYVGQGKTSTTDVEGVKTVTKSTGFNSGGLQGSRVGVKGVEDLGNGLKAVFNYEMGFDAIDGHLTANGSSDVGFGRRAVVGLQGGFGSVLLGRDYTPLFNLLAASTPNGMANTWETTTDAFQTRANGVHYAGNFAGVGVQAFGGYAKETNKTFINGVLTPATTDVDTKSTGYGLGLSYANGPFMVGVAGQQFKGENGGVTVSKDTEAGVGASYDFGAAKLFANYVHLKNEAGVYEEKTQEANIGVNVPLGAATLMAQYGHNRLKDYDNGVQVGKAKGNDWVVGANYAFSKRTDVYARVGRMDDLKFKDMAGNTVGSSKAESFGVGLRHKF